MRRVIVFPAPGGPPLTLIKAVDNKMAGVCVSPPLGATSRRFIFIFTAGVRTQARYGDVCEAAIVSAR